jgi:hypothetical protein
MAEPSAAPEPAPPLPGTVGTEADRGSNHDGTDAPHAPPPARTAPPRDTYTIQRGDTSAYSNSRSGLGTGAFARP